MPSLLKGWFFHREDVSHFSAGGGVARLRNTRCGRPINPLEIGRHTSLGLSTTLIFVVILLLLLHRVNHQVGLQLRRRLKLVGGEERYFARGLGKLVGWSERGPGQDEGDRRRGGKGYGRRGKSYRIGEVGERLETYQRLQTYQRSKVERRCRCRRGNARGGLRGWGRVVQ